MAYDEWFGYGSDYLPGRSERRPTRPPLNAAVSYGSEYWPRPGGLRPSSWRGHYPAQRGDVWYGGRPRRPRFASQNYGGDYEMSPRDRGQGRRLPPDYRRYLSREEYGLGPDWERGRGGDREDRERGRRGTGAERFNEGVLGPRNALFGREGFRRYGEDYEQWW